MQKAGWQAGGWRPAPGEPWKLIPQQIVAVQHFCGYKLRHGVEQVHWVVKNERGVKV
jgi:hypothetical protein